MKISQCQKKEKQVLTLTSVAYLLVRYYIQYREDTDLGLKLKDIPPSLGLIASCFFNIDLEDNINKLLKTRFNQTRQTWFHSLKNMPNGVIVFNTKKNKVIFENKKLEELFGSQKLSDKYASRLRSYANEPNPLVEEERKIETLMTVMKCAIRDSQKRSSSRSLDKVLEPANDQSK